MGFRVSWYACREDHGTYSYLYSVVSRRVIKNSNLNALHNYSSSYSSSLCSANEIFVSNIRRRKERELVHWVLGERGEDCLVVWWWDLPSGVFEWEWES